MPRLLREPGDASLLGLAGLGKRVLLLGRTRRLVEARIAASDTDVCYAGEGESLTWLGRIHGGRVVEHRPLAWARLRERIECRDKLLYLEVNRFLRPLLPSGGFFTLPWLRYAASLEDAGQRGKKLIEATYGRKFRQQGFTSRLLRGAEDASIFHRDFYLPYVMWRFGDETHARDASEIRAVVRHGFILQILQGDLPVAAAACRLGGESVTLVALGLRGDYNDLLRRGALSAVYYQLFRWARENHLGRVDLLRARPHGQDGVAVHKARFGARPERDPWPHALLAIYPPAGTALPLATRDLWVEGSQGEMARLADVVKAPGPEGP